VISEGMPLIYNGQEAGNPKRLAFFEKDPIEWREHPHGALYQKLLALKKANSALWNAAWGARMIDVPNSAHNQVLSFVRQNHLDKVFAVFNFSPQVQTVRFSQRLYHGAYREYFSGERITLDEHSQLSLEPWGYRVFVEG
jgi:glycosidase